MRKVLKNLWDCTIIMGEVKGFRVWNTIQKEKGDYYEQSFS